MFIGIVSNTNNCLKPRKVTIKKNKSNYMMIYMKIFEEYKVI